MWRKRPCCARTAIFIACGTVNAFAPGWCEQRGGSRSTASERRDAGSGANTLRTWTSRAHPGVENITAAREFERHVAQALDALPEKLRLVMTLAAIEGYNTSEVAKLTSLPEGTVKSRLFSARKKLAESLEWIVKKNPSR